MSSIWFRSVFRNPQIKPRKLEEGYLLSIRRVSLSGVEIQGMLRSESQKMGTEYLPLSRLQPVRFLITRRSEDCRVRGCQEDSGIAFLRQFKITLSIIESSRENVLPLDCIDSNSWTMWIHRLYLAWVPDKSSGQILLWGEALVWSDFTPLLLPPSADCSVLIHRYTLNLHPANWRTVSNPDQVLKWTINTTNIRNGRKKRILPTIGKSAQTCILSTWQTGDEFLLSITRFLWCFVFMFMMHGQDQEDEITAPSHSLVKV